VFFRAVEEQKCIKSRKISIRANEHICKRSENVPSTASKSVKTAKMFATAALPGKTADATARATKVFSRPLKCLQVH
jgi:hypothetical protein